MPDSIRSLFHCHRRFRSDAEPRTRRSKAQEAAVSADHPEIAVGEADDMAATVVLGEADQLACEGLADEEFLAAPSDLPARTHAADLVVGVVPGILQAPRRKGRAGGRHSRAGAFCPSASCGRSSL